VTAALQSGKKVVNRLALLSRRRSDRRLSVVVLAIVCAAAVAPGGAQAQTQSDFFNGGGTRTWSNAQSWWQSYLATAQSQALAAPGANSTAIFNTSGSNGAGTTVFTSDATVRGLRILQPATGGLTLRAAGGNRTLTLGSGGIRVQPGNTSALTVGSASAGERLNVTLGGSQEWRLAGGNVTISNTVSGAAASGTSQTLLISNFGSLSGGAGAFVDGGNGGKLNLWLNLSNAQSPGININASASSLTGDLTLQNIGFSAQFDWANLATGTYATIGRLQMAGGALASGAVSLNASGTMHILGGASMFGSNIGSTSISKAGTITRNPGGGIVYSPSGISVSGVVSVPQVSGVIPWLISGNRNSVGVLSGSSITTQEDASAPWRVTVFDSLPVLGSGAAGVDAFRSVANGGAQTLTASRQAGVIYNPWDATSLDVNGFSLTTNAITNPYNSNATATIPGFAVTSSAPGGYLGIGSSGELIATTSAGGPFTIAVPIRESVANSWLTLGVVQANLSSAGLVSGTFTLSGSNSHSGGTSILSRVLNVNNPYALGSGTFRVGGNAIVLDNTTAAPLTIATNNYNEWNSDFSFGGTQDLNLGTGTVSLGTWAGSSRTVTVNAGNFTVGGRIVDGSYADLPTTGLAKAGNGTLILTGSNGYTGVTEAWGGELRFANRNALYGADTSKWTAANLVTGTGGILSVSVGDQAGAFTSADLDILDGAVGGPNGGYLGIDTTGVTSGTYTYGTNLATPTNGNLLGIAKTGAGTLVLTGSNTFTGGVLVRQGTLRVTAAGQIGSGTAVSAGGLLDMTGVSVNNAFSIQSGTIANTTINASNLTAAVTGPAVISGTLAGNLTTGNLTKSGTGTLVLAAANTYSGTTTLSGGLLSISANNNLGSTARLVFNGGGLQVTGTSVTSLNAGWAPAFTDAQRVTLDIADPANSFTVSQVLNQGAGGLTKSGSGTLVLNGANTFTGLVTIAGGTVKVGNATALGTNASTLTITGGVLDLTGYSPTKGTTTFSGGLVTGGTLTSTAAYAATSGTVATTLAGTLGLTKSGTGVFVLSGSNSYSGVTTASGGFLQFATTNSLYGGVTSNWTRTSITGSSGATLAFNVGGSGEFQPANVTTLLAGLGGTVTNNGLMAGSRLGFDTTNSGTAFTVGNVIADTAGTGGGAVGLTKLGSGTLVLSASNTYTGPTVVGYGGGPNAGVLQLASTGFVSSTVAIVGGTFDTAGQNRSITTLTLGGGAAGSTASLQTGSGTVTLGSGAVTFSGNNNPAGATIAGNLNLGAATRTFTVNDSTAADADLTISAVISSGTLVKSGLGTLALTGQNTFAGKVAVNRGTVQIDSVAAAATTANPLGTSGTIDLGSGMQPGTLRWVGDAPGSTNLVLNLSGSLAGATLDASGAGALTISGNPTVAAGAKTFTLTGTSTALNTFSGAIPGSGTNAVSVVKDGPGTWRLSGVSSFTGSFTLQNGTLVAAVNSLANSDGAFGGSVGPTDVLIGDTSPTASGTASLLLAAGVSTGKVMNVQGGGGTQAVILGGEGSGADFQGNVYLGRPVTLVAGDGGSTFFSGFFYGPAGPGGGPPTMHVTIGSATNTGVVSVRDLATTGTVGVQFGTLRLAPQIQDALGRTTPVVIGAATAGATLDVNGRSQTLANLSFTGVGGTLADLAGGGGLALGTAGSAATVGVTGTGHSITAPVSLENAATFTVASGGRLLVGGTIGNGSTAGQPLIKNGLGELVLANNNSYTGTTSVNAGTLRIGDGGTTGSLNSAGVLVLGGGSVILDRSNNFTQSFAGTVLSGTASLVATAGNTMNLGPLTMQVGGVLDFSTTGAFITSTPNTNGILGPGITYGGTTWAVSNGSSPITGLSTYTLTSDAGTTPANYANANISVNSSPTLSGPIAASSIRFAAASPETLALTGSSTLTGGILVTSAVGANASAISGGTLAATGSVLSVTQDNTSGGLTITSAIADGGVAAGLTKGGAGTLVLGGANTYTGTTSIATGTLQVGSGATAGSVASSAAIAGSAGSSLVFNRSDNYGSSYSSPISGGVNLVQAGSGTLALAGANTYTGTTTINAGMLQIGAGGAGGSLSPASVIAGQAGATLAFNRSDSLTQGTDFTATIGGVINVAQVGGGTTVLIGTNTYTGTTSVDAGVLQVGNAGTAGSLSPASVITGQSAGTLAFNRTDTVMQGTDFAAVIGGAVNVSQVGSGILVLNGANTYSGTTRVAAGTLSFTSGASGTGTVRPDGGTLQWAAGNAQDISARLLFSSGSTAAFDTNGNTVTFATGFGNSTTANLTKLGTGTLALGAANTYTGTTSVTGGFLQIGNAATAGAISPSSVITGQAGGTVLFNRSDNYGGDVGNTITGGVAVSQIGTGTLVLTAANDYAGLTTVAAGVLRLSGGADRIRSGNDVTVGSTATLDLDNNAQTVGSLFGSGTVATGGGLLTAAGGVYGGVVTGAGGLTKTGAGLLLLSGSSTYTGTTAINAGTLQIGDNATTGALSTSSVITGSTGAMLAFNRSNVMTQGTDFGGVIGGSVNVSQIGSGTTVLTGTNTYTGTTSVVNGTLQVGNAGTTGALSASSVITGVVGTTLAFSRTDNYGGTFSNTITGPLNISLISSGTLTLTGVNTFSGTARAGSGVLAVGNAAALQNALLNATGGDVTFAQDSTLGGLAGSRNIDMSGRTLTIGNNAAYSTAYSGTLSNGVLTKIGTGTLALAGANTYAGTTTINAGFLQIGNAGTTGALSPSSEIMGLAAGTLLFNRTNALTQGTDFVSGIGGAINVGQIGTGTTFLTGVNTYTGTTQVAAGVLSFADGAIGTGTVRPNGGRLQWAPGNTQDISARLLLTSASTATFDTNGNDVSFATGFGNATTANVTKIGTGTLSLTAGNTYTGTTSVLGGMLRVGNGSTSGSIAATSVLTLGNGEFVLDRTSGTQAFASTLLSGAATVSAANAGTTVDLKAITRQVGGALDIGGSGSAITSTANVGGILPAVTFGGTTWAVANAANPITALTTYVLSSTAVTANYNNANVDVNAAASPSAAITPNSLRFAGAAAQTLTFPSASSNTVASGILVTAGVGTNATTITGGTLSGVTTDLAVVQNNTFGTLTIASVIASARGLTKAGPGVMTLTSSNVYTGTTGISAGTLQIGNAGATGALATTSVITGQGGATLAFNRTNVVASGTDFNATIGGAINVSQLGSGTVILGGANTYTGTTSVNAGFLQIGSSGTAGAISPLSVITGSAGGTLQFNRTNLLAQGTDFNSVIGGAINVSQVGTGTLALTGANTFSGTARVAAGMLTFTNGALSTGPVRADGGTLQWATGNTQDISDRLVLSSGSTATFDTNGNNLTFASGFGSSTNANMTKIGTGTLTLTAASTLTGTTNVGVGVLQINAGGAVSASSVITGSTGAMLLFDRGDNYGGSYGSPIAGTMNVAQIGTGTLTLTAANTYTGTTSVLGGMLRVGNGSTSGSIAATSVLVLGSGQLVLDRASTVTQTFASTLLSGAATVSPANAGTTLSTGPFTRRVGGALDIVGNGSVIMNTLNTNGIVPGVTVGGTTWAVSGAAITPLTTYVLSSTAVSYTNFNVDVNSSPSPSGAITPNSLRFSGAAAQTLTLLGTSSNTVASGILVTAAVGGNLSTITGGTLTGVTTDLAVIQNNTSGTLAIGSVIASTLGLTKAGPGLLALSNANVYTGTTAISAGTLQIGDAGTTGALSTSSPITGASGARLAFNRTDTLTQGTHFNSVIGGAINVGQLGSGRLVLNGVNTYTGTTSVSAGILEIAATGQIGQTSGVTIDGGNFRYNAGTPFSRPLTFAQGVLSGTGTIATAVTIGVGDMLSPGNSPGIQPYTSGQTWAPGGAYEWELNALSGTAGVNWDMIAVTGGLSLSALSSGSTFNLNLVTLTGGNTPGLLDPAYAPGQSLVFPIATFDSLSLPSGFTVNPGTDLTSLFTINLNGWQGTQPSPGDLAVKVNDTSSGINLVIVPEPAAIALAALGLGLAGYALRRRRL
jgi:autotransporter-associated beta strand protein